MTSATAPAVEANIDPAVRPTDAVGAEPGHDEAEWRGVSPKYLTVQLISDLIFGLVLIGGFSAVALLRGQVFGWIAAGTALIITVVLLALLPRRVRSIRYQLRADDIVLCRGIMFFRQVAVPYGRLQLVDIRRGPIARMLGLAELKFVTAAAATAFVLPGLEVGDADALRDRLVALAETRRAGL
ncbi:MAG TPA: PH domain-containing protein [Candidatus Lumbricidophila sp.]|nr:PH domain-containing protein [Candidatus Lumbricidophila sp.]